MIAALSEHLSVTTEVDDASRGFQEKWDEVRRLLYGSMFHECWPPSLESSVENVQMLPQDLMANLRGCRHSFTIQQIKEIEDDLTVCLRKEQVDTRRKNFQKDVRSKLPLITIDEGLDMQAELRDAFAQPTFQDDLWELRTLHGEAPLKFSLLRAETIFEVQKPILAKYGFEPSRLGVYAMLVWFSALNDIREFKEVSDECQMLLGTEQYMMTEPDELKATVARVEEAKERFRSAQTWPEKKIVELA